MIVQRNVGEVSILEAGGKLTLGEGTDDLRAAVGQALDGGRARILLDLGGVSYIDSSGLGELVRVYTTVANRGGRLKLVHPTRKVSDILQITKLATVFEIFDDESEAVASF